MTDLPLTDALLESLLYEDEGASLDFKRDPYPFEGAQPYQKAELLKDVLAFANAFRRATAYVLIGVKDVPGGRGLVHGVDRHPDDASLQQFVNEKTNRPVVFRYRAREVDGEQVGVIEIPVQPRPLYLTKDYAQLKARAVYVRRGSSTSEAEPDEVARMGTALPSAPSPELAVAFGRADADLRLGLDLETSTVSFSLPASIPDYTSVSGPYGAILDMDSNKSYWRDFAACARDLGYLRPLQVAIDNAGAAPLHGGRVVLRAPRDRGLVFANHTTSRPDTSHYGHLAHLVARPNLNPWTITQRGEAWEASTGTGTLLPGGSMWTPEIFVGADESGRYPLDVTVLGENLSEPLRLQASVTLTVRKAVLPFESIRAWHDGSPPPALFPS